MEAKKTEVAVNYGSWPTKYIGTVQRVIQCPRGVPEIKYNGKWERIYWEDGQPTITTIESDVLKA